MHRAKSHVISALPVFELGGREGVPDITVIGFKAHNLIRMAALGLPVPPGFVLGTEWGNAMARGEVLESRLTQSLTSRIRILEDQTGLSFGSMRRPLLVSVRSGAAVSMPGMLDTVLNVGLNDVSVPGLLQLTGDHRLVWDSYCRLILAFAEIVARVSAQPFERELAATLRRTGAASPRELDFRALRDLAHVYLNLFRAEAGREFPQDPMEQLIGATRAVFASWQSEKAVSYRKLKVIADDIGTAVTVQRMVFGNSGSNSGVGVGFTRDPSTGENRPYIDWLTQAQGEDVVSGRRQVSAEEEIPGWLLQKLVEVGNTLEQSFRESQEYEFTVENGQLYLLQSRAAKCTALATVRIAVEQVESGLITHEQALRRISGVDLEAVANWAVESTSPPIGHATPAGGGVAIGPVALSIVVAQDCASRGVPAILLMAEPATRDIEGIAVVSGLLTAMGGRTSHAAVVARQLGKVCLVGCKDLVFDKDVGQARLGTTVISEGDVLCLDGNTGAIYRDSPTIKSERPQVLLNRIKQWSVHAQKPAS